MGLFERKKKTQPITIIKKEKAMFEYKIMEQVDCDLDAAINNPNPGFEDHCKLIAETAQYRFYSYKCFEDSSGGYVLRRSNANPAEVVFFGDNYQLACIYKDYLFQCGHSGEGGAFYIYAKNIHTGNIMKCDWLGKGDVQDIINDISVASDQLIFHVTRMRSTCGCISSIYNIDTDYTLSVTLENGQFKGVALFPATILEAALHLLSNETSKVSPNNSETTGSSIKSANNKLGRDESKHISCKYEGREDDCPNDCWKCAIPIKTDGDIALARNDFDKAIKFYKKAIFVEYKFAEAWVNMGNAYGMKSEFNNAIYAFNKAIAIDPSYGKALFGKAITLKNQGKLDEAMALANEILDIYDDDAVKTFKSDLAAAGVRDKSLSLSSNLC